MNPTVIVNGREYPFITESDLTLGEAAEIEQITGQGYDLSKIGALGLMALTYVSVKRVDGSVSLEDIKELKADQIDVRAPEGDPLPPPESGDSAGDAKPGTDSSSPGSDDSQEEPPEITGTPA